VVNPVELIDLARRRLARMAALEAALWLVPPFAFTLLMAVYIETVGALTWERFGYILTERAEEHVCELLLLAAVLEVAAAGLLAWRAYRRSDDFIGAARRIDDHVRAHQEVLTLATLAAPGDEGSRARRTPLFPMLWRRVVAYLDLFEPSREFPFDWLEPVRGAAIAALVTLVVMALAMTVFLKIPTPEELAAHRLRVAAKALDVRGASPQDRALAGAMRDLARDLENPKLPPQQKSAELAAMERQLQQREQQKQGGTSLAMGTTGGGSGSGSGQSAGEGGGSGKGAGSGTGQGAGKGSGQGAGAGSGSGAKSGDKKGAGDLQIAELSKDLSKAQQQIQTGSGPQSKQPGAGKSDTGTGVAPKQGNNPNASGPESKPDQIANASIPRPGMAGKTNLPMPSGTTPSGRKNDAGTQGDTHLGEFPKAGNFERFYKPGEGPPLIIRDARYVTFRLPPSATTKGAGGRLVVDAERSRASTPYTNAPLKADQAADTPDERQMVPPRYRDLIR